jgi:hypothetical protein
MYVKLFREHGAKGFYISKPRKSSAYVLERARSLLEQGRSVPEASGELEVFANTLQKAIHAARLPAPQ